MLSVRVETSGHTPFPNVLSQTTNQRGVVGFLLSSRMHQPNSLCRVRADSARRLEQLFLFAALPLVPHSIQESPHGILICTIDATCPGQPFRNESFICPPRESKLTHFSYNLLFVICFSKQSSRSEIKVSSGRRPSLSESASCPERLDCKKDGQVDWPIEASLGRARLALRISDTGRSINRICRCPEASGRLDRVKPPYSWARDFPEKKPDDRPGMAVVLISSARPAFERLFDQIALHLAAKG